MDFLKGYVVAMVHCEGGREGGGEEGRLCSRLLCHSHLHLAVNGLETGYCRDIHGQVGEMEYKAKWASGVIHLYLFS